MQNYIETINSTILDLKSFQYPWEITEGLEKIITDTISNLPSEEFEIRTGNIAIHKKSTLEQNVVLKGPIIISEGCFIAANSYIRGGVFLDKNVTIGPGCEIKSSIIFHGTKLAHFNYIGNSILGSDINMEAGAVIANHLNEYKKRTISVKMNGKIIDTKVEKFGSLVGDKSKIGANAVLSPGTILERKSIVPRLALIEQVKQIL